MILFFLFVSSREQMSYPPHRRVMAGKDTNLIVEKISLLRYLSLYCFIQLRTTCIFEMQPVSKQTSVFIPIYMYCDAFHHFQNSVLVFAYKPLKLTHCIANLTFHHLCTELRSPWVDIY